MAPDKNSGYELSIYHVQKSHNRSSPPQLPPEAVPPSDLLGLPLELHYLILAYLDLDSLLQLRRTSRFYWQVITPDLVRRLFTRGGRASLTLAVCCYTCLCTPGLDRLVVDKTIDPSLWQSVCFRCWSNRITVDYHINPWPVIQTANGDDGYICHFCNWPVVSHGRDDGIDRLHATCRARRRLVLVLWIFMAVLQFGIGVLCAVLSWTHFKHQQGIVIPSSVRLYPRFLSASRSKTANGNTQVDFALAMISVVVFICRICTNNEPKYRRLLFMELILTILRIPPVAYSARTTVAYRLSQGLLPRFGFGIFLINLIFRLLDFMGHALLNAGYDPRRFLQKGLSRRRKCWYGVATFLVYFAYIPF